MAEIRKEVLEEFAANVFIKAGVPASEAALAADVLIKAELWNIKSHGLSRLKRYMMRLENNTINPRPEITFQMKYPQALSVDGDNGLGGIVMNKAIDKAVSIAQREGLCIIGVKNSNHFGITGYYCNKAAQKGLLSIGFSNSLAAMAPWGGKSAVLGTNPIAFGFPRKNESPVIIDMATSAAARGKILLAQKEGRDIPAGWATDKDGKYTTDAGKAAAGLLLPLAGVKGYALSLAVDVLAGVFTGALFGSQAGTYKDGQPKAGFGHMFILMKPDCFIDSSQYEKHIMSLCREICSADKADGVKQIFLPGEREFLSEQKQLAAGIEIADDILAELREIGQKYAIML